MIQQKYQIYNFYFPYINNISTNYQKKLLKRQQNLITKMNAFEIINIIGQGAYGVVLKAKRKDNGVLVAIKKFKQTDDDELIKKTTVREIKVLKSLKHKNIVQLQQAFKKKGLVHLVFQYLDNNLLQILQKNTTGLANKTIARYIYQVFQGLQYMHSLNYIHRDIKPQNLLVNSQGVLKICDMGFAKVLQDQMTDYVATRWYRPPELLVGGPYGSAIDIWAVGCIMAELSDTQPLFPGENQIDQLIQIVSCLGQLPEKLKTRFQNNIAFKKVNLPTFLKKQQNLNRYKQRLTQKGVDLLKKILVQDPQKRITASQALKHPYFDIIRPRKQRFQKTSQAWTTTNKQSQKIMFTQNFTDRNQRNSQNIGLQNTTSIDKQYILKPKTTNLLFKFGKKKCQTQNKIFDSQFIDRDKDKDIGINKIYYKKQNNKKYINSYQCLDQSTPPNPYTSNPSKTKLSNTLISNKINNNFKITHKRRQNSTFLLHT